MKGIEVVKNEQIAERGCSYNRANIVAEGFPDMTQLDFVFDILIKKCGCRMGDPVNRITFKYVEGE